jgi:hypothetical protein
MPNYITTPEPEYDDVMTVEEFIDCVKQGLFIDYDGCGCPMKDGKYDQNIDVSPSTYEQDIPDDATHIVWFNK